MHYILEAAKWAESMDCQLFWIEGDCNGVIEFAKGQANTIQWRDQAIISEALRILKSCELFFWVLTSIIRVVIMCQLSKKGVEVTTNSIGDKCQVFYLLL